MKNRIVIVVILSMMFLATSYTTDTACDFIKNSPQVNDSIFDLDYLSKIKEVGLKKLNAKEFEMIHNREKSDVDASYILGKILITKTRTALITFDKSVECDHEITYLSLHVLEKCKGIKSEQISYEDNHGFIFNITSTFNRQEKNINIKVEQSSESGMEPNAKKDTIFTTKYTIGLARKAFDTIRKDKEYKVVDID